LNFALCPSLAAFLEGPKMREERNDVLKGYSVRFNHLWKLVFVPWVMESKGDLLWRYQTLEGSKGKKKPTYHFMRG